MRGEGATRRATSPSRGAVMMAIRCERRDRCYCEKAPLMQATRDTRPRSPPLSFHVSFPHGFPVTASFPKASWWAFGGGFVR